MSEFAKIDYAISEIARFCREMLKNGNCTKCPFYDAFGDCEFTKSCPSDWRFKESKGTKDATD